MDTLFGIKVLSPIEKGIAKKAFKDITLTDEGEYFLSNEVFTHEEDDLNFKYRYLITVFDMRDLDEDDKTINFSISILPEKESLCTQTREEFVMDAGVDFEDLDPTDLILSGASIRFALESLHCDDFEEHRDEIFDLAATIFPTMDRLFGFYMDKPVNRIGTTGWDFADWWLKGTNPYAAALDRFGK